MTFVYRSHWGWLTHLWGWLTQLLGMVDTPLWGWLAHQNGTDLFYVNQKHYSVVSSWVVNCVDDRFLFFWLKRDL